MGMPEQPPEPRDESEQQPRPVNPLDGLDALPERAAYKAQWMATRSPAEQAAWLEELRRVMGDFPNAEQFIRGAEDLMKSSQVKMEADIRAAHSEEQLEATAASMLDELMSGEEEMPEDPWQRAMLLLFLTSTGHQYPYLRERMGQEDVQEFLSRHVGALFKLGREEDGEGEDA